MARSRQADRPLACGRTRVVPRVVGGHGDGHWPGSCRTARRALHRADEADAAPVYGRTTSSSAALRSHAPWRASGVFPRRQGVWSNIPPACSCVRVAVRKCCCAAAATAASAIAAAPARARRAGTRGARPPGATSAAAPVAWRTPRVRVAGASDAQAVTFRHRQRPRRASPTS